jgi:hypothetical protein
VWIPPAAFRDDDALHVALTDEAEPATMTAAMAAAGTVDVRLKGCQPVHVSNIHRLHCLDNDFMLDNLARSVSLGPQWYAH